MQRAFYERAGLSIGCSYTLVQKRGTREPRSAWSAMGLVVTLVFCRERWLEGNCSRAFFRDYFPGRETRCHVFRLKNQRRPMYPKGSVMNAGRYRDLCVLSDLSIVYTYRDCWHTGFSCDPGRSVRYGSAQLPGGLLCVPGLLDLRRVLGAGCVWHCRYPIKEIITYIVMGGYGNFRSYPAVLRETGFILGADSYNHLVSFIERVGARQWGLERMVLRGRIREMGREVRQKCEATIRHLYLFYLSV